MDFFSKTFSNFVKVFNAKTKEVGVTWSSYFGESTSSVGKANLMANNKNWVFVCVDKIADSVSAINLKLIKYDKSGNDTEIFEHPVLALLYKPNLFMTGKDFKYITIAHLELTGSAYWLKDTPKNPSTLFPLNPKNVSLVFSKDGQEVTGYKYRSSSSTGGMTTKDIALDMIIHLKYPNPESPLEGRGTLEPIADWVDMDNYSTEFNKKFFQNGATFGGAIETDATSKEALTMARLEYDNNHKGLNNAHKLLFLPKGSKLNEQGLTPKDMQMQEADSRFRDKILAAFKVPKSVVGIVEDVNRANAESSNYVFTEFTVKPKLNRIIIYLEEYFLPLFTGTEKMYFKYDDPTPVNVEIEIRENQAALGNAPYMSVNEVRAKKGLPPIDGGDAILSPLNLYAIGEVPQNAQGDGTKKVKHAPRPDAVGGVVENLAGKAFELFTKNDIEVKHKLFINRVTVYELLFEKNVREHDQKQKQNILSKIRTLDISKQISPTELFDKEAEIKKMYDFTFPLMRKLSKDEGERATELVKKEQVNDFLKKDYSVSSRLQGIIEASVQRMSRSYTQTTLDILVQKINDSIYQGYSMIEITREISDVYGLTETYRASRIARTEVFSAANDASKDAFLASGVVKTIKWKTAEDELTCEECAPMDNKIISVEQNFFNKGEATATGREITYENVGNPPLHPNCRCFILPETIGLKSIEAPKEKEVEKVVEKIVKVEKIVEKIIEVEKEIDLDVLIGELEN